MTIEITLQIFGIPFRIEVSYEQDDNRVSIDEILDVYVEGKDKANHRVNCDKEALLKCLDMEIYEALEEAINDERIANAEMAWEAKRGN